MWQLHNRADMRVYREQRASAQQSIIDIRSSVDQFPNEIAVREAQNRQARVIREANAYMYNQMIGLQNRLIRSEGRDIDLKRVDPQRGIEQFERTTGR
jgi:hypothetical protein